MGVCVGPALPETGVASRWDDFYRSGGAPAEPSDFARWLEPMLRDAQAQPTILDLGCGNGRDANFFARVGYEVIGVDASAEAIRIAASGGSRPRFICADIGEFLRDRQLPVDVVYLRWILHAIALPLQEQIFAWAAANLRPGGLLAIEARHIGDKRYGHGMPAGEDAFVDAGHYRRFLLMEHLALSLAAHGFRRETADVGTHLSPTRQAELDGEPMLIRFVAALNRTNASPVVPPDQVRKPILRRR